MKKGQSVPAPCTCEPGDCLLDKKCKETNIIYEAALKTENNDVYKYIGLTEKPLIQRIQQHESSFRVHDPRNSTSLSKKVLNLQRSHILFDVSWKILQKSKSYTSGGQECRLCLLEIYFILFTPADGKLNSRTEFFDKCRHKNKFKLSSN